MTGLALLVGHLVGDYIVQNDWMAKNKTNQHPKGGRPHDGVVVDLATDWRPEILEAQDEWGDQRRRWRVGHLACLVHCLCYTLAVWAFSFWWMPWWGLVAVFVLHFPLDRFRLAGRWMRNVAGQRDFAGGPLAPWSVIVVDNTFHLIVLVAVGLLAPGVK